MKKNIFSIFRASVGIIFLILTLAGTASAADIQLHFKLAPAETTNDPLSFSRFLLTGNPGEQLHKAFILTNQNVGQKHSDTVLLYAVDEQTGLQGGDICSTDPNLNQDIGNWIQLSVHQVTMNPGEQETIPFTITIPHSNVRVGEHYACIIAVPPTPTSNEKTTSANGARKLNVIFLTGGAVRMRLIIPGKAQTKLQVKNVQPGGELGKQSVVVSLLNNGDKITHPHGDITVLDATGKIRINKKLTISGILPQTSLDYNVDAPTLEVGDYTGTLNLQYESNSVIHKQFHFTITPAMQTKIFDHGKTQAPQQNNTNWFLIIGIIFAACLLLVVGLLIYALAKATRKNQPPPSNGNNRGNEWSNSTFPYAPQQLDIEKRRPANGIVRVTFFVTPQHMASSIYGSNWPDPPRG